MPDLRKTEFTFVIVTLPYDPMSGGVRALFLLCHLLNCTGFTARMAVVGEPGAVTAWPAHLNAPPHDAAQNDRDRVVAIYPEIFGGNVLKAGMVIRYLLNKPGAVTADEWGSYGESDLMLAFDMSHVPAGRQARELFLPLVDRSVYFPPATPGEREGSVFCGKVVPDGSFPVPRWLLPVTAVTPRNPLSHTQLGSLYRRSSALLALRRTTAIYEALCCGCPVVCYPSDNFNARVYQPRFGGAGLAWSRDRDAYEAALAGVPSFLEIYSRLEREAPQTVERLFLAIVDELLERR